MTLLNSEYLVTRNPWHKFAKFNNLILREFLSNTCDQITAYSKRQTFITESVTFSADLLSNTSWHKCVERIIWNSLLSTQWTRVINRKRLSGAGTAIRVGRFLKNKKYV